MDVHARLHACLPDSLIDCMYCKLGMVVQSGEATVWLLAGRHCGGGMEWQTVPQSMMLEIQRPSEQAFNYC